MKSLKIFLLSFVLVFAIGLVVTAQETPPVEETNVEAAVNLDEDVQPEDLEVSEPRLLPDSPFYFLKNWARGIQNVLTFNPIKKAELRLKIANEKLMEVKKIVQKTKDSETIKKAAENYQQEAERVKKQVEKIKEKAAENPKVESFLDKFIDQQTLHQKLLQKLESQVPPQALEKIKKSRDAHLENFQGVMLKLEDRQEKITEKLDKIMEEQKGSEFKEFKNLEVLKNLEEKVPEQTKEAIQKAQENALKRLQDNLEKMSPADQEKFKEYTEKISGAEEEQLKILENLKSAIKATSAPTQIQEKLQEKLEAGKTKILEKIEKGLEKLNCPLWVAPAPGFCKEGRVIVEKNETGCPLPPRCIIPGEVKEIPRPIEGIACIALWDPVCGKDGRTYSNSCFAKLAGVEMDYKGVCRIKCPEIKCVWDPCPGEHIPDSTGCINCASPCKVPPALPEQPSERKEQE